MSEDFNQIAEELEARGAVSEARELQQITKRTVIAAPVVEAVRLLDVVQAEASKDPSLMNMAARASLLSHQIQNYYSRGG